MLSSEELKKVTKFFCNTYVKPNGWMYDEITIYYKSGWWIFASEKCKIIKLDRVQVNGHSGFRVSKSCEDLINQLSTIAGDIPIPPVSFKVWVEENELLSPEFKFALPKISRLVEEYIREGRKRNEK